MKLFAHNYRFVYIFIHMYTKNLFGVFYEARS